MWYKIKIGQKWDLKRSLRCSGRTTRESIRGKRPQWSHSVLSAAKNTCNRVTISLLVLLEQLCLIYCYSVSSCLNAVCTQTCWLARPASWWQRLRPLVESDSLPMPVHPLSSKGCFCVSLVLITGMDEYECIHWLKCTNKQSLTI